MRFTLFFYLVNYLLSCPVGKWQLNILAWSIAISFSLPPPPLFFSPSSKEFQDRRAINHCCRVGNNRLFICLPACLTALVTWIFYQCVVPLSLISTSVSVGFSWRLGKISRGSDWLFTYWRIIFVNGNLVSIIFWYWRTSGREGGKRGGWHEKERKGGKTEISLVTYCCCSWWLQVCSSCITASCIVYQYLVHRVGVMFVNNLGSWKKDKGE